MSRFRLDARLRQNEDYKITIRICAEHNLTHNLRAGGSHPILTVTNSDGKSVEFTLASTPRSVCRGRVESRTKRILRDAGLI